MIHTSKYITHTFEPVYDESSKILILGTMPSPKSRENNFYYTHPQNRFWKTLAAVTREPIPQDNMQRVTLLKKHNIALWDVLSSCEIVGASDSSIKNPAPNDINMILRISPIQAIFTTGKKATEIYGKYIYPSTNVESIYLPSPSAANRANAPDAYLIEAYKVINNYLR